MLFMYKFFYLIGQGTWTQVVFAQYVFLVKYCSRAHTKFSEWWPLRRRWPRWWRWTWCRAGLVNWHTYRWYIYFFKNNISEHRQSRVLWPPRIRADGEGVPGGRVISRTSLSKKCRLQNKNFSFSSMIPKDVLTREGLTVIILRKKSSSFSVEKWMKNLMSRRYISYTLYCNSTICAVSFLRNDISEITLTFSD